MIGFIGDWNEHARCRTVDPDLHFADGKRLEGKRGEEAQAARTALRAEAKAVCSRCPVQRQCLETALKIDSKLGVQWGIWGGKSSYQRQRILTGRRNAAA